MEEIRRRAAGKGKNRTRTHPGCQEPHEGRRGDREQSPRISTRWRGTVQEIVSAPDIRARLENTGQLLVRSGIEIDRILGSIAQSGDTVSADLPSDVLFLSRLVGVDSEKQAVVVSYSDDKSANSAVLCAKSLA